MFKNYFKVAFRNLAKNKVYSFINISGLAVSLAAGVLVLLWVKDELSFDGFHKNAARIYIAAAQISAEGKKTVIYGTPAPLAVFGKKELPEVEDACRVSNNNGVSLFEYKDKSFVEDKCAFADPSFFSMFSFPLIKGDPAMPFKGNRCMVISASIAKKYFGSDDPIGKTIRIDNNTNYAVTGVMQDIPSNSSIQYNFIFPNELLKEEENIDADWGSFAYRTYFLLKRDADDKALAKKLEMLHRRNNNNDFSKDMQYLAQPLTQLHLYKADGSDNGVQTVRIFFLIACIILLIACINYVNLVTARATKRAKEISMRKIIGAGRMQLFRQFLSESLLLFFMALLVAIALIYLAMPVYNTIAGKTMQFSLFSPGVVAVFGITLLATLLLAGIYPALMLSSFKPLEAMKGKVAGMGKNAGFRKALVIVQFSFSIILITSTIIIGRQLKYVRDKNLGYDKENVLAITMRPDINDHYEAIKARLLKQPGVLGVTAAGRDIMNNYGSKTGDADWDGKTAAQSAFLLNQLPVERDLFSVMKLKLVVGKGFSGTPADSSNFILNQTAIAEMGIKDPVGKRLTYNGQNGTIAGVVKDFYFQNMHTKIEPCILFYHPGWRRILYIKTTAKDASGTVAALENIWKQYNPAYPFKYSFMDENFSNMYKADEQVGKLFNCFAIITIVISCLGLLGLVTYTAETRLKEIGIRKTLGASAGSIVRLLSKDFITPVVISSVIAFPVAYWAMDKWLQNFAYRTAISPWVFIIAAAGAITIALATVGYQSIKAALINPVKSLKSE